MKNDSVILELQRATHATLHLLTTELVDLDLTASEINALGNLADGTGRTVSELGAAIGTRPATLTGILDRLERRGLITRAPRPGDRRAVLIALTADGRRTATLIRRTLRDVEQRALAGLPADAVRGARAVLRALTEVGR
ncbi:DNA-binding MarR family transcriptional regulator [Krasilnikovia cinnamomea]|uniref:DNA-binding MarR family transcriptional regulator n=1 Tax=Krasilnikovia cinnamomea TaxID=349313 RepID=A0A4Q7ZFC5_9ACTN|nr:MarR family transcriptional regulator [Krasilnikovia cinnamomea]RZU48689.1 DNA-binding MarR family transcriptional regulator [Krasilnikovia cinnamomea]